MTNLLKPTDPEKAREHQEYITRIHEHPIFSFSNSTRYVIMVLSIICLAWLMGNSLVLNFTIICMSDDGGAVNGTNGTSDGLYHYTHSQQSWLFAIVAIGSIAGTYPVMFLETRATLRKMFTLFGLISGISTMLIPAAASWGFYWLLLMRFLEGFAMAASYPMLGAIVSNWSTLKQSGMYTAWMSCNLQFGCIIALPVSGAFCVSPVGWRGAYYTLGGLTIISYILFYLFFRDSPRIHRFVSAKELKWIEEGKTGIREKKLEPVPYKAILKSLPIWGVWICCTGATFGYQIFVQYGPIYLNKVLHFKIENTGFMTAFANIVAVIVKVLGGPISDLATCVSAKNRVRLFTLLSQGTMALSFVVLALVPPSLVGLAQVAYTAAVAFSGLMWVGPVKSGAMVSMQHSHFVFLVTQFTNSVGIIVLPPFVNGIAPDNTPQQWAIILFSICGAVIVCTAFFTFTGEAEPAWWTKPDAKLHHHHNRQKNTVAFEDQIGHAQPC